MVILELHYERGDLAPGMVNGGLKKGGFLNNVHAECGLLAPVIREQKRRKCCGDGHFLPTMARLRGPSGQARKN